MITQNVHIYNWKCAQNVYLTLVHNLCSISIDKRVLIVHNKRVLNVHERR